MSVLITIMHEVCRSGIARGAERLPIHRNETGLHLSECSNGPKLLADCPEAGQGALRWFWHWEAKKRANSPSVHGRLTHHSTGAILPPVASFTPHGGKPKQLRLTTRATKRTAPGNRRRRQDGGATRHLVFCWSRASDAPEQLSRDDGREIMFNVRSGFGRVPH
jgi:hypothetical protein